MAHLSLSRLKQIKLFAFCTGRPLWYSAALVVVSALSSCIGQRERMPDKVVQNGIVVSVKDQKLAVLRNGKPVRSYDISTSKYGLGSRSGSYKTPRGVHAVASKVGSGQPKGMVFESCRPTGQVIPPNTPGHDQIVSRVIQLNGLESGNKNSFSRRIYIHGTAEETKIGTPASYGCIRMRSDDVVELYEMVARGEMVAIEDCSLATYLKAEKDARTPILLANGSLSMPAGADMAVQDNVLAARSADADDEAVLASVTRSGDVVEAIPSRVKARSPKAVAKTSFKQTAARKGAVSRKAVASRTGKKASASSSGKNSSKVLAKNSSSRKGSASKTKLVTRKPSLAMRSGKTKSRG